MNERLYAAAGKLTDDERKKDTGAFFKSIHATLNHLLVADRIWMGRLNGVALRDDWIGPDGIRSLDQELHPDFDELFAGRQQMDDAILRFGSELTVERLASNLRYVRAGAASEHPIWWAIAQMFNHQTHHRGQVTTLLMQSGHDPGVTDLIAMLRSEK